MTINPSMMNTQNLQNNMQNMTSYLTNQQGAQPAQNSIGYTSAAPTQPNTTPNVGMMPGFGGQGMLPQFQPQTMPAQNQAQPGNMMYNPSQWGQPTYSQTNNNNLSSIMAAMQNPQNSSGYTSAAPTQQNLAQIGNMQNQVSLPATVGFSQGPQVQPAMNQTDFQASLPRWQAMQSQNPQMSGQQIAQNLGWSPQQMLQFNNAYNQAQIPPSKGGLQQIANTVNAPGTMPQTMPQQSQFVANIGQGAAQGYNPNQPQQSMSPLQRMRQTGMNPMTGRRTQSRTVDPQEMQRRMQQMQAFKAAHSKG